MGEVPGRLREEQRMLMFVPTLRDHLVRLALEAARRLATPEAWAALMSANGVPNMRCGLRALRDKGVSLTHVVDCGAFIGDWTRLCRQVFPDANVLMIEPQPRRAEALERFSAENGSGIRFANALLGSEPAEAVDFFLLDDPGGGTGSSVLSENSNVPRHSITLAMTTLDRTIEEQEFPPPEFIKLDVQGYELEVLKGATRALASAEFVLLEVSVWQYNENSPLIEEVVAFMSGAGFVTYDVFDINRLSDGTLLQLDVLFIRKDSSLLDEKRVVYA